MLVRDGQILEPALRAEGLSKTELYAQLRSEGVECMGQVRFAYLEPLGWGSVLRDEDRRDGLNIGTDDAAL